MRLSDSHLHPCDGSQEDGYPDIEDLEVSIGCTARASEWDMMRAYNRPGMYRSYGVHPWYADEWCDGIREELICILERDNDAHVGEIGLDSKRGDVVLQTCAFRDQLSISAEMGRVASVHMVGPCEKMVLDEIRRCRPNRGTILHSFTGPESYIKPFVEAGCFFSISPRILQSPRRMNSILPKIPKDRILLETDYPHVGRNFESMTSHTIRISEILGMQPGDLGDLVTENLRRLIDHG